MQTSPSPTRWPPRDKREECEKYKYYPSTTPSTQAGKCLKVNSPNIYIHYMTREHQRNPISSPYNTQNTTTGEKYNPVPRDIKHIHKYNIK